MPEFVYKALTAEGQVVDGKLSATHRRLALQSLESQGLVATDLQEASAAAAGGSFFDRLFGGAEAMPRIKGTELTELTRQLATMISSDVTLIDALTVIYEQAEQESTRTVVGKLRDAVKGGESLSTAMAVQPRTFTPLFQSMVRVGEAGGMLAPVLIQMADLLETEQEVRGEIKAAMAYPLIVLGLGAVTVVVIFTFVMPRILSLFKGVESALPAPTRVLMGMGAFMRAHWWHLGLALLVGALLLRQAIQTERGRAAWDRFWLRTPLLGALVRKAAIARFSRCLGALLQGGVPLLEGLQSVGALLNNRVMTRVIDTAMTSIKEGSSFAASLRASGQFPPMVTHMIGVGEKTGKLDQMLLRIADTFERQTRIMTRVMISMLAPLLIIVVAVVVALIALALLLPIFKINQLIR